MRIVITRPISPSAEQILRAAGHDVTIIPHDRALSPQELLDATANMDGLLSLLTDRIDAAFLNARPNIRAVANCAVGYNNIDVPACTARRVGVSNTPDVLNDATAEIAWTFLMMAARRAGEAERTVRAKAWPGFGPLQFLGQAIVGKTLGILGAGRIGTRLARMAAGFDMQLLYHNRTPNPEMQKLSARFVDLPTLLKESDFLSIHTPLTAETRHLIAAPQLALMKPTAILINTARGPIVDEAALVAALQSKQIFAAGLDVYENEPTLHPGLFELENVVLLPHIGSATVETRSRMAQLAADNLIAMLAGQKPPTPVNPELWN